MSQKETVLLTGASGFLGSHLLKGFLNAGYRVFAFKRKTSNLWRLHGIVDNVEWFDIDDLERPFKIGKIDHVVHAATCYGRNNELPSEVAMANLFIPLKLFELASLAKVITFLNTDTFFNNGEITYRYLNSYILSKKQLCEWLKQHQTATKVLNIKLEHVYGPADDQTKFVPYIIDQLLKAADELPLTKGEQKRDFVYVDDVVNAYLCLLKNYGQLCSHDHYQTINVGSGVAVTIKVFVETAAQILHSQTKLLFGMLPYREGEIMQSCADLTTLRSLQWEPKYLIDAGINEIIRSKLQS